MYDNLSQRLLPAVWLRPVLKSSSFLKMQHLGFFFQGSSLIGQRVSRLPPDELSNPARRVYAGQRHQVTMRACASQARELATENVRGPLRL